MNPQHTVPTLDDNGFVIWDSHAINGYLIGKYGKDDALYPKDVEKRAVVDQRLHFDSGILFPRLGAMVVSSHCNNYYLYNLNKSVNYCPLTILLQFFVVYAF